MNVEEAYNQWADTYDTGENKTRDLEAYALRNSLSPFSFEHCLEIGCGTGKNTVWLSQRAARITAIDLSEKMLAIASKKIQSYSIDFIKADVIADWDFVSDTCDLVTFSLVLEHIECLEPVILKASRVLNSGGYLYIGELHPFKQYTGSKARFETAGGTQFVTCFTHHISDFILAAKMLDYSW